jgi:hypothetical protein
MVCQDFIRSRPKNVYWPNSPEADDYHCKYAGFRLMIRESPRPDDSTVLGTPSDRCSSFSNRWRIKLNGGICKTERIGGVIPLRKLVNREAGYGNDPEAGYFLDVNKKR